MFFSSKPKAAAGSPDALPADAAPLPPVASGSMDSDSMKKAIIQQVMAESNMTNARQLMENMNQHCFDSCIPKPGSTFSSGEQKCVSQCMEKYIAAWNHVNAAYMRRIQQEVGSN